MHCSPTASTCRCADRRSAMRNPCSVPRDGARGPNQGAEMFRPLFYSSSILPTRQAFTDGTRACDIGRTAGLRWRRRRRRPFARTAASAIGVVRIGRRQRPIETGASPSLCACLEGRHVGEVRAAGRSTRATRIRLARSAAAFMDGPARPDRSVEPRCRLTSGTNESGTTRRFAFSPIDRRTERSGEAPSSRQAADDSERAPNLRRFGQRRIRTIGSMRTTTERPSRRAGRLSDTSAVPGHRRS